MHFQVRTDNHIHNTETLTEGIRAEVEAAIGDRFADRIRRVEVYLQDMNGHKGGIDIRCAIEVSIAGHQPLAVHDEAAEVDDAVSGAIDKMTRIIEHTLGRIEDKGGRISMSGEPT